MESKKQASRGVFILAIGAFFLPFFNVTCADQTLATVTGVDLLIGGEAEFDQAFIDAVGEEPTAEESSIEFSLWAAVAALGAVLGLIAAFRWVPNGVAASGGLSVAALLVLWLVESNADAEGAEELAALISIKPAIGWLLALLASIVGGTIGLLAMRQASESD